MHGLPATPGASTSTKTTAAPVPEAPVRAQISSIAYDKEPLRAYGFRDRAKSGDTAQPQTPPTHEPRKNENLEEQTRLRTVQGSAAKYNLIAIRDLHNVIDWFPDDHPKMPPIIEHGPVAMGEVGRGCGSCHLPSGRGRPENVPPGGLPVRYFTRQINDFREGLRYSADPRKPNTNTMMRSRRQ